MLRASPRWTPENDSRLSHAGETFLQHLKAIVFNPPNLVRYSIDFGVVLGTFQRGGIPFNGENTFPPSRLRKSDSISTDASKGINQHGLARWSRFCHVSSNGS